MSPRDVVPDKEVVIRGVAMNPTSGAKKRAGAKRRPRMKHSSINARQGNQFAGFGPEGKRDLTEGNEGKGDTHRGLCGLRGLGEEDIIHFPTH
jgi:hypothetical protein